MDRSQQDVNQLTFLLLEVVALVHRQALKEVVVGAVPVALNYI